MKIAKLLAASIFLYSCSNIEFILSDNSKSDNKLYSNTEYTVTGDDIPGLDTNIIRLLGRTDKNDYLLNINVNEEITKRSVEKNQVSKKNGL